MQHNKKHEASMHQTSSISNTIVNLGTRTYRQRLETISGIGLTVSKLKKLNKDLDDLYELLYGKINSITKEEVISITPLLNELLKSVEALNIACPKYTSNSEIGKETEKLSLNCSALKELLSDFQNFRIPSDDDSELMALLSEAAGLMQRIS